MTDDPTTTGPTPEPASDDETDLPTETVVLPRTPTQDDVIDALERSWDALARFAADFDDDQWNADTPLGGWRVRDIYAHIIGAERTLVGDPVPDVDIGSPAHVQNDIGRANEAWVQSLAALDHAELLTQFTATTRQRLDQLRAMSDDDWTAPSWTPAGDATIGRWMHIRVFDCWVHEQDVRVALGLPGDLGGPASDLSLLEVVFALGYIVGKRGEAPDGAQVEFRLRSGSSTQIIRVEVVEGRATVVEAFGPLSDDAPATQLTLPYELFMRLVAGRRSASNALTDGLIEITGDGRLGERIARNLAFTV